MKRTICKAERVRRERRREIFKLVMVVGLFFAVLIALCSVKTK